jgi:SNF2 family DNA or RNA helicase
LLRRGLCCAPKKQRYSVAIFDEMQKIKDPGTLNTWASKAMNADFVIGLTGTPIENRIEDLWSIMDRVFPGFLADLKNFSKAHQQASEEKYRALSDRLLKPIEGAPAIMLRRMKDDVLEGLPPKRINCYRTEMPPVQAEVYGRVVLLRHNLRRMFL